MLVSFSGATWQATDESRHLVAALQRALSRASICPKEAASLQGISDKQWDNQLHGRCGAHVSLYRIGLLVLARPDVMVFWLEELAERVHAQVITDTQMRGLIDKMQTLILQLQAADAYRSMVKAELRPPAEAETEARPGKERAS